MAFKLKAQKSVSPEKTHNTSLTTKTMHNCKTNQKKGKFRDKIE